MEIERLKKAFIAADDAGDTESASMFAAKIRELQASPTPEKSVFDRTVDNFKGLGAGAYDLARGLAIDMPLNIGMQLGGLVSGEPASVSRQAAKMAAEDATKGITGRDLYPEATQSSTYNMMMYPFEKITEGIDWVGDKVGELTGNKELGEGSKIAMDVGGAVLPIPGARIAGKAFMKGMEKIDPALRDQPPRRMPDLDTETVVGKPKPEPKQYMGPLFENLKDVDTTDVRNPYRDNIQPDMFDSHLELQQLDENRRAPEGYEQALEAERPLKFDEPSLQPLKDPMQEASPQSELRFGEDPPLKSPQELALDYDPFSLKQPENMAMDPQRKALDIDLLPERVSKDTVVKGQITKYNRLLEEHNRLMDEARTQGLEGTRIKYQELGKTKKAKEQIDAQATRLETIQKQMDNLAKQLQRRMEVKHNFLYDEGWMGAPLYSGTKRINKFDEKGNQIFNTKTDSKSVQGKGKRFEYEVPAQEDTTGVYSEFPPSVEGPAERATGLTVEKMERPDMQRSPDANITGAGVVKKTFSPMGGVGKKQGGAVNFGVVDKGVDIIRTIRDKKIEVLEKLRDRLNKVNIHDKEAISDFFDDLDVSNSQIIPPRFLSETLKEAGYDRETIKLAEEIVELNNKEHKERANSGALQNASGHVKQIFNVLNKAEGKIEAYRAQAKALREQHKIPENTFYSKMSKSQQYWERMAMKNEQAADFLDTWHFGDLINDKSQMPMKDFVTYLESKEPQNTSLAQRAEDIFKEADGIAPKAKQGLNKGTFGQSGGMDFSGLGESLGKLFKGAQAVGKRAFGPDPYKPKNLNLSHENKIRKITGADARDIPTFVKEVLADKDNLVDIPKNMSVKGVIRKDLTPSAVGRLSYENNPIISYVNNRLNRIDGAIKAAKETALWGKGFGTNLRGKPVKGKSDDGARTIMKTIPSARREGFRAAVNKYMDGKILEERGLPDPTDTMLREDGLNAREIQAYRSARKQMDTVVDKVNESLVAAGQKPITKKPGYFPAIWMGDYRVFVKNAKGETVKTLAFDHQFQVDMIKEEIKKLDPSLKVDFTDASNNKYNINDLSAFQLASEVFQHDPKLSKLLDAARSDILQHRGYKKHGLQKKGVEGYLGSEKGGFADMEQAIDIYLEQAYNFLGDQEKRATVGKLNEEFQKNGYTVSKELPNTSQYVNDIVANSIGSVESRLKLVDDFFEGLGEFSGEHLGVGGKSTARKFNKMLNGIAGFYNLATAKQLAINAVQPLYSLAKAQQLKVELNTENVTLNLAKAYKDAFLHESVSKMSPESRKALEFARKSGLIDARTLELINANTGQAASNTLKTVGHGAAWWEQEAVRVPAYLFYDHMLRDTIKNPEARWEAAAQLTEHTMVNYSKTQTPAIYAQAGLVGDSLRPYQQFTHNYHGQFLEYMQLAKRQKEFRPLATFLAAQATLGGIRGLVPLTAVGGLIALYNMVPGVEPVPTPEEYLMGSGMSDDYVFGPLSKVTGANLSGSAGAPNIVPLPGVPGLSWGSTFATDAIGGGIKMMAGMDEESDRMKALLAISPSAAKGWVEELFQDDQGRIPNPNRGMQPDVDLERTDREWFTKKWIGAEPLREGAQKARIRASESEQKKVEEKRKQLFDKFVDDFVSKGEFNSEILGEYIERGGDPDGLTSSIRGAMEKRMLSRVQDALLSKKDLSQAQYLQLMEKYQLEISQMELKDLMELNDQ